MNFRTTAAICCGLALSSMLTGCARPAAPTTAATVNIDSNGNLDPEAQLTAAETEGLSAAYFPHVQYGAADGELAYLVFFDVPREQWESDVRHEIEIDAKFTTAKIDEGTLEINGRSYPLQQGRVFLIDTVGGPDKVIQTAMPGGASDPEQALRDLFENNLAFRTFLRHELREALDSISLRGDAALQLYKSQLAEKLSREDLHNWLEDDNQWVRLMAADALWEATKSTDARDVLQALADTEPADSWPAKLARRELEME